MNTLLDADYWKQRYQSGETGWDIGGPNRSLLAYIVQHFPKSTKILIPGAGKGHEALALWSEGYSNTYVCDWAEESFSLLRETVANQAEHIFFGSEAEVEKRFIVSDFFTLTQRFDVILEQTFFCAINPSLRPAYVEQCRNLLVEGGYWVGILFNKEFPTEGPPFGGDAKAYKKLFSNHFEQVDFTPFAGSIKPRLGVEVFGSFRCKSIV